jgi:circadian clock protein KaiC
VGALDALIGGAIPWRFGVMLMGPAGSGKSSLAAQLAYAAACEGKQVCMYSFEEAVNTLLTRCENLGIDIGKLVADG